jgi:hypothetical protein
MTKIWQERSEDDVVTLVWFEHTGAAGLAVSGDTESAAIRLDRGQLRALAEWLSQYVTQA